MNAREKLKAYRALTGVQAQKDLAACEAAVELALRGYQPREGRLSLDSYRSYLDRRPTLFLRWSGYLNKVAYDDALDLTPLRHEVNGVEVRRDLYVSNSGADNAWKLIVVVSASRGDVVAEFEAEAPLPGADVALLKALGRVSSHTTPPSSYEALTCGAA